MRIALLAPIAWRVPPRHYGPWERVVSLLAEGLVARGVDVILFATLDSETSGRLEGVCRRPYEEDPEIDAGVWGALHTGHAFEQAGRFDLVHNHFDFRPLTYSGLVQTPVLTTIHGFSSERIVPVYQRYDASTFYAAISDADRHPALAYAATVYHGIDLEAFTLREAPEDYLLFFGRIHPDKGAADAIEIARRAGRPLVMAGIVQDEGYFRERVEPHVDGERVRYVGSVGPADRDRLLGGAAALLHPIHFDEPFGLSVVEAMACGTPVVATARGSMAEVIDEGETGVLVADTEAAIDEAVRRLPEALALDRRGVRARAEARFSQARMAADYHALYARILSGEVTPTTQSPRASDKR